MAQPGDEDQFQPRASTSATTPPTRDISTTASDEQLAHELQNPIARIWSVPLQNNFDFGAGEFGAFRYTLNVQPIIPFTVGDVQVISRTILPIMYQESMTPTADDHTGLGDTLQSFFFGPKTTGAVTWGVGPALLLPTATAEQLGSEKWALGPTAVLVYDAKPWMAGVLANHIWSFAGDGDRADVNQTFVQPFVSYTLPSALSFTGTMEMTHYQAQDSWALPLIVGATQLVKVADQPVNLGLQAKYWLANREVDPEWGLRFTVTVLIPRMAS